MSAEPKPEPVGTGVPDDAAQQQVGCSSDPSDASVEASPSEQRAKAPWLQATDPSGALKASREMPEPDSLGG